MSIFPHVEQGLSDNGRGAALHCGLVWALLPQLEHCDAAIDVDGGALGAVRCGRLAAGDLQLGWLAPPR